MDDPGGLASERGQDLCEDGSNGRVEDADELVFVPGRIEEWAEEIEHGAFALLAQQLPRGGDGLEGRVIERGEEEAGSDFGEAAAEILWRQVDADTESFEGVGAAAL